MLLMPRDFKKNSMRKKDKKEKERDWRMLKKKKK